MRVLGLVPARGGSKGIPRKNLVRLGDRSLLEWTAGEALQAETLSRIVLSTDDEEIAEHGRRCGLEVPFLRPAHLAADGVPTLPVVQWTLRRLEEQGQDSLYDAVCLLQPTSPFRTAEDIDGCVRLLKSSAADSVVSVRPVPLEFNPHWVYVRDDAGRLSLSTGEAEPIARRQMLPPAYHRDGAVYVTRRAVLLEANSLFGTAVVGYLSTSARHANIDSWDDLWQAEKLLACPVLA